MWYFVKLTDNMMKPTRAVGFVEAESKENAKERAKTHIGDSWHNEVTEINETDFDSSQEMKKYINKSDYNLAVDKNGNEIRKENR